MKAAKGEFLLEVGCEEIPARMLDAARASLQVLLEEELRGRGLLDAGELKTFCTPRRLVATAAGLASAEPDRVEEAVGPPVKVAYDPEGKPTRAAESFARKQGIGVSALKRVETPKGDYVAAVRRLKGKPTRALLSEIFPAAIRRIDFPRTMYWTSPAGLHFIRPIRWLLALWEGKLLPFELDGLRSSPTTRGHRLLADRAIRVTGFADYRKRLESARVLIESEQRRRRIETECERALKSLRLGRRADSELLTTLVNLVEYPAVVLGEFDKAFLNLPAEVLVTVMRHHQKYFSVEDKRGQLAPHFLAVIDLDGDKGGEIRRGHEAVLAARFRDAQFFWQADQRKTLDERVPLLEQAVFVSGLGNYSQKVQRMARLAMWLGENSSADGRRADSDAVRRAAQLSKSDLTTEMVGEFPELQGVVGGLYAREQGEPEPVARAIAEQYRPAGAEDAVPATLEGSLLSVADKLDSITGCFAVGLIPTGSRDPYALRRAGSGLVRIVVESDLRLSIRQAIEEAVRILEQSRVAVADAAGLVGSVESFLEDRARHLFRELRGCPYDEVNAAFAAGWDDLVDTRARLEALRRIRPTPDFEPLAVAFKRIANILEQAGDGAQRAERPLETERLEKGPEADLYERFLALKPRVAELRSKHRYQEALKQIATLRPQVDRFFDTVLVMTRDDAVRENRLTLLAQLLREFSTIADFSQIVVTPKNKE
jgi:glycyl-tRNA synthetase beta chain